MSKLWGLGLEVWNVGLKVEAGESGIRRSNVKANFCWCFRQTPMLARTTRNLQVTGHSTMGMGRQVSQVRGNVWNSGLSSWRPL